MSDRSRRGLADNNSINAAPRREAAIADRFSGLKSSLFQRAKTAAQTAGTAVSSVTEHLSSPASEEMLSIFPYTWGTKTVAPASLRPQRRTIIFQHAWAIKRPRVKPGVKHSMSSSPRSPADARFELSFRYSSRPERSMHYTSRPQQSIAIPESSHFYRKA